jgi:hypothetical protein
MEMRFTIPFKKTIDIDSWTLPILGILPQFQGKGPGQALITVYSKSRKLKPWHHLKMSVYRKLRSVTKA